MFYFFSKLEVELPSIQSATWNYSEAGHGKGAPDGVGGVLKRTADRIVAQGADVSNFDSLVCVLKKHCEGVTLFIVTKEQIAMYEKRVSDLKLTPFRGTFNVHQVGYTRSTPEILSFRRLSCFQCNATSESCEYRIGDQNFGTCEISKKMKLVQEGVAINDLNYGARQDLQYKRGSWVAVQYEGNLYPGEITEIISEKEIKISAMEPAAGAGNRFLPLKPDILIYQISDIVQQISSPVPFGIRGKSFIFSDF